MIYLWLNTVDLNCLSMIVLRQLHRLELKKGF